MSKVCAPLSLDNFDGAYNYSETIEAKDSRHIEYADRRSGYSSASEEGTGSEDEEDEPYSTPALSIGTLPRRRTTRPPSSKFRRTLRRRPYLIFNKTPPRGFKKLTPKSKSKNTASSRKNRPGDGFSDGEARPDGLGQALGKRKLTLSAISGAGALDLTQSSPPVKRKKRIKRADDNSFITAPRTPKLSAKVTGSKARKDTVKGTSTNRKSLNPRSNTTERAPDPSRVNAGVVLRDRQDDKREDNTGKGQKIVNLHNSEARNNAEVHRTKEVGPNSPVTITEAYRNDLPILPCSQPPGRSRIQVSPARTWDTYIEESSPFRQRRNSEEATRIGEDGDVPITTGRAFRREKTA